MQGQPSAEPMLDRTLADVRTIVSDPPTAEFEALLERRPQWRADRHDEIWEGVYRMIPAPGEARWLIDEQVAERLDWPGV